MEALQHILSELEILLGELNYPILKQMQRGVEDSSEKIDVFFSNLKLPIRNDIIELYGWKNGVMGLYEKQIGTLELFPNGIMLPLDYAISTYALETKALKRFDKDYFPLFTSGGGDYILICMNNKKKSYGQLSLFSPSIFLTHKPVSVYDSITSLFATVLDLYRCRGYFFDGNNLKIDYEVEKKISLERNPNSIFWLE